MARSSHEVDGSEQERIDEIAEEKRKARKARRKLHNHMPDAGELNITAMLDMLTIILVFLLKSYNTEPAANINSGVRPPVSSSTLPIEQSITVTVTNHDISVDDVQVVAVNNGQIDKALTGGDTQPLLIPALQNALLTQVEKHRTLEAQGGVPFKGNLLVIGDRAISYQLLTQVLYSAGQAQLANFKFVTIGQ